MEHSVHLGTRHYYTLLNQRLEELQEREVLPLHVHKVRQGNRWLFECQFALSPEEDWPEKDWIEQDESTVKKIFQYYLANAVADTILNAWEKEYVRKLLGKKYKLMAKECDSVLNKTVSRLNDKEGKAYKASRKSILVQQILLCLENNLIFDIEGFLRFRGKDYKEEIDKAVAYTVDEFILEREYLEFIELLKSFVDTQNPCLDTLHVGISQQGRFHLYDDLGNSVTERFLTDYHPEEKIQDISYDDLLVSALIMVAPRHIVLHIRNDKSESALQSIQEVFGDRVSFCTGCALCDRLS